MKLEELSSELRDKIAGKSPEELLALANEEGYELSNEEVKSIAGGGWSIDATYYGQCPYCGESVRLDEDWCPSCGMWFGEGEEPDIAPAREA